MTTDHLPIILGSRSPRRLELLRLIVPEGRITVVPPVTANEPDFRGANDWTAVEGRLREIARLKCEDVLRQVGEKKFAAIITADTVIVANEPDGCLRILGQPPEVDWKRVVRGWFEQYLLGKDHVAASAVCVAAADGRRRECVVRTRVRFDESSRKWLDWYLDTDEPRGKAGGYGIQGAGGLFVSEMEGSLSNVVGLPVRELLEMLDELGIRS